MNAFQIYYSHKSKLIDTFYFFCQKDRFLENQLFFNHEIEQSNSIQTSFLLYLKIIFSE